MNQSGRNFSINTKLSWAAKVTHIENLDNAPPFPLQRVSVVVLPGIDLFFVSKGTQITQVPVVMRQPLDLFKFFTVVRERGGLQEVSLLTQLLMAKVNFYDDEFCRSLLKQLFISEALTLLTLAVLCDSG